MSPKIVKYLFVAAALLVAPMMYFVAHRVIGATEQRIVEREAVKVAEVVAQHAVATRRVYESQARGDAPAAGAFIDSVGIEARRLAGEAYSYRWIALEGTERSRLDDFQRSALAGLDQRALERAPGGGDLEPVWQLGLHEGKRVLRYLMAVTPAGGRSPGRIAGALEVLVPVEQVEAFAAVQARGTQNLVISLGAFGLSLMTLLAVRSARQQRGIARQYEQLAKVDPLTGLANRLALEQAMHDRLKLARRYQQGLGVMFIDVDDFKNINDSLGHTAGDEVLRVVAARLRACLRESDLIARYSGDEFVVLAINAADARQMGAIATKLLESAAPVISVLNTDIFITLSIGIACYPSDGPDVPTLLRHADSAMYRVKDKGRNGFQFFAAEMNDAALEKLKMSSSLRHALRRNEFLVYYQPKVDARSGRLAGFEALVRWNHPEQGLLAPGRFIAHAENSGAIEPLGEWVLGAALAQARAWRDGGNFSGTIAVNLSMRQLYNTALPAMVRKMLADNGIRPGQLELEITESMVSLNPELAAQTLRELSQMGVSIAIDDFGTGQSSLAYLMRFPIRTMKIDRSFTDAIPGCADTSAIVRAIIVMAKSLRMRVVAEGVESVAQRAFFESEGCDELQGYLIGAPLSASEATQLLEDCGWGAKHPARPRLELATGPVT